MFTSDAVTRGIKVHVESEYAPGAVAAVEERVVLPLHDHHHQRGDGNGAARHPPLDHHRWHRPRGRSPRSGVVGKQPVLAPGESFTYTSGCPLATPFGVMEGTYQMVSGNGEEFDAKIAPFTLSEPYTVH